MWKKNCKKKILVLRTKFNGMKDIIMEFESVTVSCKFEKKDLFCNFIEVYITNHISISVDHLTIMKSVRFF